MWLDNITIDSPDKCWPWVGAKSPSGYGHFGEHGKTVTAHRRIYEICRGPIPEGFDIHHRCEVRHCVNPNHLEPLSRSDHNRTKFGTACPRGHEFDTANTWLDKHGKRHCHACHRIRERERRGSQRA